MQLNVLVGGGPGGARKLVSIWCDHHLSQAVQHIFFAFDQVVDCGMLVHSSSMTVWTCWILAGTGTRCRIRRSRASQTCLMGDMSGEYAGHARTGMFSASRNYLQILAIWGWALSCCNMRWWSWMNGTTMGLRILSCIQNAINIMHLCSLSITYACPYHNPIWSTRSTALTSANRSPTRCHTCCLPSALYSENRDSSVKRTPLQSARRHRMWAFSHSSRSRWRTAVRSRPRWGWRACRWASLRRFLTACAEILWLCKQIVVAAVRVAGLRRSWRWRCWMWRSWAGVVTRVLWLWGRLDVLPNSLKRLWRRLMVDKLTFNSRATALVDIPAVSMPIAHSLKTCDICGIVLWDKTAHFRVVFYCGQH